MMPAGHYLRRTPSGLARGAVIVLFAGLALFALRPAETPLSPAGWFREVALRAARDTMVSGRRAVDAYWQAQSDAAVEPLYRELSGGRIAHARLTERGWRIQGPT